MAKLVYKGKINGNDVVYKEDCFHGPFDRFEGGPHQNIMYVVTETGKKFRFRVWDEINYVTEALKKDKILHDDKINEAIIKEKGKRTQKYNSRNIGSMTFKEKRTKLVMSKANEMYNSLRREIMRDLIDKPKDKKLESLIMTEDREKKMQKEVEDIFDTDPKNECLRLYKNDPKSFMRYFSKITDNKKKEALNLIFQCEHEDKVVIEWLNKNYNDLLREVGFDG